MSSRESEAELELIDEVGLSFVSATPHPTCSHTPTVQPSRIPPSSQTPNVGCRWDPIDYSCSYDCVFTAFAWMYFHATERWRTTWANRPPVAKTLSHHFRIILHAIEDLADDRTTSDVSMLFSRGRDAFRDVLSAENPVLFKRHGPTYAPVADILDLLSRGETPSQYFSAVSSCGGENCTIRIMTPTGAPYMLSTGSWASITHSGNPPHHESLQQWVDRWFNHKASSRQRPCAGGCTPFPLTLSFLEPPWIWFDIFLERPHASLPAFELTFSSYTYRLAAAIYGNGRHFVARLSTPSGAWWYYDGRVDGGQPTAVSISGEEELITCGPGYILNALVYCSTR